MTLVIHGHDNVDFGLSRLEHLGDRRVLRTKANTA